MWRPPLPRRFSWFLRCTSDLLLPLLQQQAELVELVYAGGQPEGQRAGEDTHSHCQGATRHLDLVWIQEVPPQFEARPSTQTERSSGGLLERLLYDLVAMALRSTQQRLLGPGSPTFLASCATRINTCNSDRNEEGSAPNTASRSIDRIHGQNKVPILRSL